MGMPKLEVGCNGKAIGGNLGNLDARGVEV
jgi:hypothetical protein